MPYSRRICKICKRADLSISKRGLCWFCARERMEQSTRQMKMKEGDCWEKWKQSMKDMGERLEVKHGDAEREKITERVALENAPNDSYT